MPYPADKVIRPLNNWGQVLCQNINVRAALTKIQQNCHDSAPQQTKIIVQFCYFCLEDRVCFSFLLSVDDSLLGSKPGGLLSAAAVTVLDKVYIYGGFKGRTQATMFRLTLPSDLCQALTSKEKCVAVPMCNWCDVHNVTHQGNITLIPTNQSACFSVMSSVPATCHPKPNVTQVSTSLMCILFYLAIYLFIYLFVYTNFTRKW